MIIDTHCDTLNEINEQNCLLRKNSLNIDLERASAYDGYAQFFAAWIENDVNAVEKFNTLANIFDCEIEKNNDIVQKCISYSDMTNAIKNNKIAAFLSLEGAYFVKSQKDIDYIYSRGVRCTTLTWNPDSALAGGVDSDNGITALGRELIPCFENKGILIDVSHLNEKSFWDIAEIATKPFIASHSCSKAICSHKRNLTDEQFLKICDIGGCVGVNFYSNFLSDSENASVSTIIKHIKHFRKIGSIDCIGLGSDFDGVDLLPDGIVGIESMSNIINELEKEHFTSSEIEKITFKNYERILKEIL